MMDYAKSDDSELWRSFKKGDDRAFSQLYKRNFEALWDYGIKLSGDSDLLSDCIQELFIYLLEHRSNLAECMNVRYYLIKALKHKIYRALKKSSKVTQLPENELNFPFLVQFSFEQEKIQLELTEEKRQAFVEGIKLLSNREKEALYLRFSNDFSYEEIARILEIEYQSCRNLVHRAIKKVRESESCKLLIMFLMGRSLVMK